MSSVITPPVRNSSLLRTMVRGAYDIQKLRIMLGNRIVGNFKTKLGLPPSTKEDEMDSVGKKILLDLRTSYKKLTDGVKVFPPKSSFLGDGVISSYSELCLVAQYIQLEKDEDQHFRRLGNIIEEHPLWDDFLKGIAGVGPAMAGVLLSEIDIHKCLYPSSLHKYCFPAGSLVQTAEGTQPIETIREGQIITTARGEEGTVQETMVRSFTGTLLTIKATGCLPFSCTDEHPVLTSDSAMGTPSWKPASEIQVGDYLIVPQLTVENTSALSWNASKKAIQLNPLLADSLPLTAEVLWLLGRFVADGSAPTWTADDGNQRGIVQISDGKSALPDLLELKEIVEEYFGKARIQEMPEGGYNLVFGGQAVARKFTEWFGQGAAQKKIPPQIMGLTERELILAFLQGYLFGDGCVVSAGKSQGTITASSASPGLMLQMQLLLTKVGTFAPLHCTERASTQGEIRGREFQQQRERYVIALPQSEVVRLFPEVTVKSINRTARKVSFQDGWRVRVTAIASQEVTDVPVYNLRVSNGNTYLVNNVAVHNCGFDVVIKEDGQGEGRSRKEHHLVKVKYIDKKGKEQERNSITFNPFLKTKMFVLASSFLRAGGPYAEIYRGYKHRLENHPVHAQKTKLHRHNMATRYMLKIFLIDLYTRWRTIEGLSVAVPYAEGKLGIQHSGQDMRESLAAQSA